MNMYFNPLLLNWAEDKHPRSWVCIKAKDLHNILRKLEKELSMNQELNREEISKKIASRLGCSPSTIRETLRIRKSFYPIPIILELLRLAKSRDQVLKQIKENIEYLKVNSASSKPIVIPSRLNKNLAKIIGSFMADGSLSMQKVIETKQIEELKILENKVKRLNIVYSKNFSPSRKRHYLNIQLNKDNSKKVINLLSRFPYCSQTHYNIELCEEYKDNVDTFIKWVKKEFKINPSYYSERKNSWRVIFSNKLLARFLMSFFEVSPGTKTYTTHEPQIIKESNLKIRKSFAKGVLMFDGCVSKNRGVLLSVKSRPLHQSIKDIWKKDKINFGKTISKRKEYILFTTQKNEKIKLLSYFEKNTQKWKLLNWLSGNLSETPIIKSGFRVSIFAMEKKIKEIKKCDIDFLAKYFKCSNHTIKTYIEILERQNKIKISNNPKEINENISSKTKVLLNEKAHELIFEKKEKFKKDKQVVELLKINKSRFSAWKKRKNKIPVHILKELCKILEIDFNKISKNIEKTNKKIIEVI